MTWHKIEERRPDGLTDAEWISQLEEAVGSLLESVEDLAYSTNVDRFWPDFEGWAATMTPGMGADCRCKDCDCCEPIMISAIAADWIDPDGEKPDGWRLVHIASDDD